MTRKDWLQVEAYILELMEIITKVGSLNKKQKEDDENEIAQRTTDAQVAPAIVNFLEKLDH